MAPRCSLMRNTIRMNSAAMRENTIADDHAGDRGQQQDESAERRDRHRGEAGEDAGNAEQHDQADHQPVERLDDRGRDETVPLKQILKIEHRSFPQLNRRVSRVQPGCWPSPESRPRTSRGRVPAGDARRQRASHADSRVEIAANNGHNRASSPHFPIMTTLTFEDFPPGRFRQVRTPPRHARGNSGLCRRIRPAADASRRGGRQASRC